MHVVIVKREAIILLFSIRTREREREVLLLLLLRRIEY